MSLSSDEVKTPPAIYGDMPVEDIVAAAIEFGGKTLADAKKTIRKTNQQDRASTLARIELIDNYQSLKSDQLISAVNLYQNTNPKKADEIFEVLVKSDRKLARDLAWIIAAERPSKKMKIRIDSLLTDAIENDELSELFSPQMAEAIANNEISESYTVVLEGLYSTHDIHFAKALINLDSKRASDDFLQYLSLVNGEDLRQLTIAKLNPLTCALILEHMISNPVDVSHPNFSQLFLFAASRNLGLAQLARQVIQHHLPQNTQRVAMKLSRMPTWVQVSYINSVSKNMAPIIKVLLSDLKKVSAKFEVIDEIDMIKF